MKKLLAALALFVLVQGCDVEADNVVVKVSAVTPTSITLEWQTPYLSDDGDPWQPIDSYELRYSTSATAAFTAMTPVPAGTLPSPGLPRGSTAYATMNGLQPETTYYFIGRGSYNNSVQDTPKITATTAAHVPDAPVQFAQASDDGAAVPDHGLSSRPSLQLQARVSSPIAGVLIRIDVELRATGEPFTGVATHAGDLVANGAVATVDVGPLPSGSAFEWKVRAHEEFGTVSGWVAAGDFSTRSNSAPYAPFTSQHNPAAGAVAVGGDFLNANGVRFLAAVSDADADEVVRLEIELRRPNEPFTGVATDGGAPAASGAVAEVLARPGDGAWKWQSRTGDRFGAFSAWTPFGGNSDDEADFLLIPQGSTGSGCQQSATGSFALLILAAAAVILRR